MGLFRVPGHIRSPGRATFKDLLDMLNQINKHTRQNCSKIEKICQVQSACAVHSDFDYLKATKLNHYYAFLSIIRILKVLTIMSVLSVTRLNAVPAGYKAIMALQEAIFQQRKLGTIEDTMILLQVNILTQYVALDRECQLF
jgi:hypothetical protein